VRPIEKPIIQKMTLNELLEFYEQRFSSMVEYSDSNAFGTMLCATVKDVDVSIAHVHHTMHGMGKHYMNVFLSNVRYFVNLILYKGSKVISGDTATSIIRDLILNLEMTRDQLKELD
jgi:hypothetical protein